MNVHSTRRHGVSALPRSALWSASGFIVRALVLGRGYRSVFRAGLALFAVGMLGLAQLLPFLHARELEANKARFELEARILMPVGPGFDCRHAPTAPTECRHVMHALTLLDGDAAGLARGLRRCRDAGLVLMLIGALAAGVRAHARWRDSGSAASA